MVSSPGVEVAGLDVRRQRQESPLAGTICWRTRRRRIQTAEPWHRKCAGSGSSYDVTAFRAYEDDSRQPPGFGILDFDTVYCNRRLPRRFGRTSIFGITELFPRSAVCSPEDQNLEILCCENLGSYNHSKTNKCTPVKTFNYIIIIIIIIIQHVSVTFCDLQSVLQQKYN